MSNATMLTGEDGACASNSPSRVCSSRDSVEAGEALTCAAVNAGDSGSRGKSCESALAADPAVLAPHVPPCAGADAILAALTE